MGPIKINKTERVQDGVERIDFSSGLAAIDAIQEDNVILRESADVFSVTNDQLPKTCERFFTEWKAQKNEIEKLQKEIAELKVSGLSDNIVEVNGLKVLKEILSSDIKELVKIATDFTDKLRLKCSAVEAEAVQLLLKEQVKTLKQCLKLWKKQLTF